MLRQLHQNFEQVHYCCHHSEYSLPFVGMKFVMSHGECLRVLLILYAQLIWLKFDVELQVLHVMLPP
jgi:hypothetical protein